MSVEREVTTVLVGSRKILKGEGGRREGAEKLP